MRNKKLFSLIIAVALVAVVGVGATLAYFTDNDVAKNVVTMGHVDIELEEPHFDKAKDDEGNPNPDFDGTEDNKISKVLPGQVVPKDPTITVQKGSADAYIRAQVKYDGLTKEQIADLQLTLEPDWTEGTDGYYYYNKIVKADDKVVLFKEVNIPKTWGNDVADMTFEINVFAEAIQADNFEPVKTGEAITGWGEVTVETYEAAGGVVTP